MLLQILLVLVICLLIPGLILFFYRLKKSDHQSRKSNQGYRQVESDLKQISEDLAEIRLQLDDVAPYLRDMEFLKYARQNRKSEKK